MNHERFNQLLPEHKLSDPPHQSLQSYENMFHAGAVDIAGLFYQKLHHLQQSGTLHTIPLIKLCKN